MKFLNRNNPNLHAGQTDRHTDLWSTLLAASFLGFTLQPAHAQQTPAQTQSHNTEAAFYPYGGGEELAIKAIASAKQSIFLATDTVIRGSAAQALADARKRGVNILVILDKSQEKQRFSGAKLLAGEGIQVHIDRKHAGMNNNYMIIDGQTVGIGRFNYTETAAKKNADNVLVMWNQPEVAKTYRTNWQEHWDHSDPYR